MEQLRETATISEQAAQTAKTTGKMRVQFISPGWGTSGYYSPEILQEAAANRVIPAGTHMYADHPGANDRPERSIRDLMAVTTSDAQLASNGALVGEVRVMAPYQDLITDLKDHIGVSVLGDATDVYEGEAEGRKGRIVAGLAHINSVDFVTRAGRGGQVLELLESAAAELGDQELGVEEAGKVYHFKHGWIPLDHAAAGEAMATGPGAGRRTKYHVDSIRRPVDRGSVVSHKKSKDEATVVGFDGRTKINVVKKDGSHTTWYSDQTMLTKHHNEPGPHNGGKKPIGPSDAEKIANAEKMFGTGSKQHVAAKKRFGKKPKESDVPATRLDSTTTIEETLEVTMDMIQIEESEHDRLLEEAGRVDELSIELETTKAALKEALAASGSPAAPPASSRNPRQLIEAQLAEQKHEIAVLTAKDRAREVINEELAEAWIAVSTSNRLFSDLIRDLPLVEEKLDENALRNSCAEARTRAELEAAETLDAAGLGKPRGLGAMTTPAGGDPTKYADQLAEGMKLLGLTEAEANAAAKGH